MKTRFFPAILLAGALALIVPTLSSAASLGLTTVGPTLEASFAGIDYLEFGTDGDLSTFGAEVDFTDGVSPVGLTEIGFGFGFSLAAPTVGATGGFDIFDEDGFFLGGTLIAVGFTDDVIGLQFGNLGGAGAGSFGASVLALISFDDLLGPDPFASLVDGEFYPASITVSNVVAVVAAVPEPATLLLVLTALVAGSGWIGRRRNDRT